MTLHEGSLKLAGLYLAIMMAISLFFSSLLYETSLAELDRSLRHTPAVLNRPINIDFPYDIRTQLMQEREQQYQEAHDRVLSRLIVMNIAILIGGGALSYYLAVRTLKPIEEAHASLERFTADASHELRTPITAMRTENEVALMDPSLTLEDAKKQLHSNVEELEKLTALSEGLLRLAQSDGNHLPKEPISPAAIVEQAVARVQRTAEQKGITITTDIKTKQLALGNQASITEALVTLLDNAIKYSPKKTSVSVTATQAQKQIAFKVRDKGAGIAAADLPHIFERFYRADTSRTKQKTDGYGLGLAIAQSIAESHGGTIVATSKPGKGSIFTLSLPAA